MLLLIWTGCGWGETDCQLTLRKADAELLTEVVALIAQQEDLPPDQFEEQLLAMRQRELNLFEQAKACNFTDPVERNYWYRGRMKFPSQLEQALSSLSSQSEAP